MPLPNFNDDSVLDDLFSYHAPTEEQIAKYQAIRDAAKEFVKVIVANSPASADQTVSIRKVREAVYSANASIALGGRF